MVYVPDLIKEVIGLVNKKMMDQNNFEVLFQYGLYQDVSKEMFRKKTDESIKDYSLIYLIMPFVQHKGREVNIDSECSPTFFIMTTTETGLSMQEREEVSFKPKLNLIYDEFLLQLSNHHAIEESRSDQIEHDFTLLPYWGGNESGNAEQPNFTKDFIDAIRLENTRLTINNQFICKK